jgi:hypothetical protein
MLSMIWSAIQTANSKFTATSREGDWVQVENPNWKGWINSQFLAPNKAPIAV